MLLPNICNFFYLREVPQAQAHPKQHLENSDDDRNLHLISIHKNDFVFCYLKQFSNTTLASKTTQAYLTLIRHDVIQW
jgi:hypothetical protein